ncbi:MAG TPA: leucyl aminopeptidase family protein, partial [Gammaproteobacteria bacterium]|nr:leucyl aminopeptidase family protein [Gammaproteobacteria bacterium]
AKGMFGMHGDMQGSAVAAGTLLALARLKVPFPADAWLALATNDIGPAAYRQNEVVTALNGTTIEIVHTDAEGRMVLSDTLTLASRTKPALMVDYATLTGSCIGALSNRYTGAFTNRDELREAAIAAGAASGERVWPFPTDADYDEALESQVADTKQCTVGSEADHILAARFLGRFVEDGVPWLHLDLSSGESKGGLGHVPTEATGFGVRFTLEFLARHESFGL